MVRGAVLAEPQAAYLGAEIAALLSEPAMDLTHIDLAAPGLPLVRHDEDAEAMEQPKCTPIFKRAHGARCRLFLMV